MTRVWASKINAHGEDDNFILYKVYDDDEVPSDLKQRVQRWANELICAFYIDDNKVIGRVYEIPPKWGSTVIRPQMQVRR